MGSDDPRARRTDADEDRAVRDLKARQSVLAESLTALSWERVLPPAALILVALLLPWGRLEPQDRDEQRVDLTLVGLLRAADVVDRTAALGVVCGILFGCCLAALATAAIAAFARRGALAVVLAIVSSIGVLAGLALAFGIGKLEVEGAGVFEEGPISLASPGWTCGMLGLAWAIVAAVRARRSSDLEEW